MSDALCVGTRKGLFQLKRQANNWSVTSSDFLGAQVPIVKPTHDGQMYAALKHGHFGAKLQHSDDAGQTWQEITTPAYPPQPEGVADVMDPMRNQPVPWSLELIWALARGNDDRLWCGTLPGGLFTSDDRGQSWQLNDALWQAPERANWFGGGYDWPGIHSICIDPRDPQRVTVGISCGGVWHSEDGGAVWECRASGMRAAYMPPDRQFDPTIQDPHLLVQCPAAPDHFWTQHHNGIFRSTDYCQNWSELPAWKPSSFGFAVVVHPCDPNSAWFAPAISDELRYPHDGRFVITRTRDGGTTHDVLTAGLPQAHAYHLVFRHALAIDSTGETLAVGSTTGGLWISHNSGDDWTNVTQDLPPIFCVEFASGR
jgi:photosystem II stability/assembly factor-like uncharacterized protein